MRITVIALTAFAWGLWWIPLRWLEAEGLSGGAANFSMMVGAALPMVVWFALKDPTRAIALSVWVPSVAVGIALSCYGLSLMLTDVSRAVLFFYLSPAWALLFEVMFAGRRFRPALLIPVGLSMLALLMLIRFNISLSAFNLGDLLALLSGASWAFGAAWMTRQSETPSPGALTLWACLFAAAIIVLTQSLGPLDLKLLLIGAAMGAAFLAPVMLGPLWGATFLGAVTVTILLTLEILSGLASAALLLDEPFGWFELTGLLLIAVALAWQLRLERSQS